MFFPLSRKRVTRAAFFSAAVLSAGTLLHAGRIHAAVVNALSPMATAYGSFNWAGYADTVSSSSSGYSFTSVSGEWTVPTVQAPADGSSSYAAFWVGLDGFSSSSVEQTGVLAEASGGATQYFAWYEMYPNALVPITTMDVKPGDVISASVTYGGANQYTLLVKDLTTGQSDSVVKTSTSSYARSSAEWIAEAPTIQNFNGTSSISTLANFGSVTFSNAAAGLENSQGAVTTEPVDGFTSGATANSISMVTPTKNPTLLAVPSGLSDTGSPSTSSFTISYVPEPGALGLLVSALVSLVLVRRRRAS